MKTVSGYERWCYTATHSAAAPVFPDGCRDVLVVIDPDGIIRVTLTEHDLVPRHVCLKQGTQITGFRLRPGSRIDPGALDVIADNPGSAEAVLTAAQRDPEDICETIIALTRRDATLRSVASDAGVSERTLQRQFRAFGLPSPDYWRLLARARRAAAKLTSNRSLADIAGESGYSDQAHLSRECVRWFGATPGGLRRTPDRLALICQPALGNWTGEQTSTR